MIFNNCIPNSAISFNNRTIEVQCLLVLQTQKMYGKAIRIFQQTDKGSKHNLFALYPP